MMAMKEIEHQKLSIEACEGVVFFYDMLLHEAKILFKEETLSPNAEKYISNLKNKKEEAENAYFENLAELWLLESLDNKT